MAGCCWGLSYSVGVQGRSDLGILTLDPGNYLKGHHVKSLKEHFTTKRLLGFCSWKLHQKQVKHKIL